MDKGKASQARVSIREAVKLLQSLGERVVRYRKPITPGKVTAIMKLCGNPNCKCTRGERHPVKLLYVTRGGPLQRIYIRQKDLEGVRERSERYRSFRRMRADLSKAFKLLLQEVDALEAALTEAYVKDQPTEGNDG